MKKKVLKIVTFLTAFALILSFNGIRTFAADYHTLYNSPDPQYNVDLVFSIEKNEVIDETTNGIQYDGRPYGDYYQIHENINEDGNNGRYTIKNVSGGAIVANIQNALTLYSNTSDYSNARNLNENLLEDKNTEISKDKLVEYVLQNCTNINYDEVCNISSLYIAAKKGLDINNYLITWYIDWYIIKYQRENVVGRIHVDGRYKEIEIIEDEPIPTTIIEEEENIIPTIIEEKEEPIPTTIEEENNEVIPTIIEEKEELSPTIIEEEKPVPTVVEEEIFIPTPITEETISTPAPIEESPVIENTYIPIIETIYSYPTATPTPIEEEMTIIPTIIEKEPEITEIPKINNDKEKEPIITEEPKEEEEEILDDIIETFTPEGAPDISAEPEINDEEEEEEILDEIIEIFTPQGAPEEEEELQEETTVEEIDIIEPNITPQGLPQTGTTNNIFLFGSGIILILFGSFIIKQNKKRGW